MYMQKTLGWGITSVWEIRSVEKETIPVVYKPGGQK